MKRKPCEARRTDHRANLVPSEGEREERLGRSVLNCHAVKGRLSKPLGSPQTTVVS